MTEQIAPILTPPIRFLGRDSTVPPAKQIIWPERILASLGLAVPTSPMQIVACSIWNQAGGKYPADCEGDVSLGIDPEGKFCAAARFPEHEDCEAFGILPLIRPLEFRLGHDHGIEREFIRPRIYRPGIDRIIFAPEVGGADLSSFDIRIFFGVLNDGYWQPQVCYTVFDLRPNTDAPSNQPVCLRSLIPAQAGVTGTRMRVRVSSLASGCALTHCSIGRQASGANMTAAPAPVPFNGGQSALLIVGAQDVWSDWFDFAYAGQALLFNASLLAPGNVNCWAMRATGGAGMWGTYDADSYAFANMAGSLSYVAGRTDVISGVQVM